MILNDSDDSNYVEVNGISFETFLPEQNLNISSKETKNDIELDLAGICISNNTPKPIYFSFYATVIPEIIAADGQLVSKSYNCDCSRQAEESDIILAMSGEDIMFFPKTVIKELKNNLFQLSFDSENGEIYTFELIKSQFYKLQLNYINKLNKVKVYSQERKKYQEIKNIWTGLVNTPFVEFQLT
ncbi:MAG: hypothetical protein KME64_00530 [Scytonematopsis contorta HA4267-MV1]|jgi:hypothetical protein|nr:hypothetical protein [Scytonematopsis contorta HA4267-MV1]